MTISRGIDVWFNCGKASLREFPRRRNRDWHRHCSFSVAGDFRSQLETGRRRDGGISSPAAYLFGTISVIADGDVLPVERRT
jgi:hypothetical protein